MRAGPFIVPEEVARGGLLPSSPPDKRNVVLLDFLRSPLFLCNSAGRLVRPQFEIRAVSLKRKFYIDLDP